MAGARTSNSERRWPGKGRMNRQTHEARSALNAMTGPPAVSIQNLSVFVKNGRRPIVENFSCDIIRGETVSLFGPSGQGKTSVALALAGLLPEALVAEWAEYQIDGVPLQDARDELFHSLRGTRVGFVFQDPLSALNPVLSCGEQIEEPLRFHRLMEPERRYARAIELLGELGIKEPERIYRSLPGRISGGQRQRVLMARAMIANPVLLIADEPTTALDPNTRQDVLDLLKQVRERHDMAILLITHDRDVVMSLSDRTIDISGTPRNLESRKTLTMPDLEAVQGGGKATHAASVHAHPLLAVSGLTKSYPSKRGFFGAGSDHLPIFANVDLEVFPGEVVGLIGASGAGKTTLIRCIAGLLPPDSGTIRVDGVLREARRSCVANGAVQIVFQNPYSSLPPHLTIRQAMADALRAAGDHASEERMQHMLSEVGLDATMLDRYPKEMSGGQCQRVAIARCLARQPRVLLADEPTASLDDESKRIVVDLLRTTAITRKIAVLIATHDHTLLTSVAERTLSL